MTELKDPLNNRVIKSVPIPFQQSLTEDQLIMNDNTVNWNLLK
jgi:hypothetical protein